MQYWIDPHSDTIQTATIHHYTVDAKKSLSIGLTRLWRSYAVLLISFTVTASACWMSYLTESGDIPSFDLRPLPWVRSLNSRLHYILHLESCTSVWAVGCSFAVATRWCASHYAMGIRLNNNTLGQLLDRWISNGWAAVGPYKDVQTCRRRMLSTAVFEMPRR